MAMTTYMCFPLKIGPYTNYFVIIVASPHIKYKLLLQEPFLHSLILLNTNWSLSNSNIVFSYLMEEKSLETERKGQLYFGLNYSFKKYTNKIVEKWNRTLKQKNKMDEVRHERLPLAYLRLHVLPGPQEGPDK